MRNLTQENRDSLGYKSSTICNNNTVQKCIYRVLYNTELLCGNQYKQPINLAYIQNLIPSTIHRHLSHSQRGHCDCYFSVACNCPCRWSDSFVSHILSVQLVALEKDSLVDAVGRNRSERWEDHLWTGRDRGEREGEKKGKRGRRKGRGGEGRRERGRRKKGGILRNMVTFVAGLCKLVQYGMACSMSQLRQTYQLPPQAHWLACATSQLGAYPMAGCTHRLPEPLLMTKHCTRSWSYLSLHDLEPLGNLTDSGGESRASGHKPQEEDLLLVCEEVKCLPQPLHQLVPLGDTITISGKEGKRREGRGEKKKGEESLRS